jgi:hypothetical protein
LRVIRRRTPFQFLGSTFEIFRHPEPVPAHIGIPRKLSEGPIPFRQSAQFPGVFHGRNTLLNVEFLHSAAEYFDLDQSGRDCSFKPPRKESRIARQHRRDCAAEPDIGELGACEEDLVLIARVSVIDQLLAPGVNSAGAPTDRGRLTAGRLRSRSGPSCGGC